MKKISLSLNAAEVYSYSIQCNEASGTFSYSTKGIPPSTKDLITVESYTGIVERVGPSKSVTEDGYHVEGRLGPQASNEYVTVTKLKEKNELYSLKDIAQEIVSSAGVDLLINTPDVQVEEFIFTGHYIQGLNATLSAGLCGKLIIINNIWRIVPKFYTEGEFSPDLESLIDSKEINQSDNKDDIISLLDAYKQALREKASIEKEIEGEEEEEEEEEEETEDNFAVSALNFLGEASFEFGWKNGRAQQQLEANKEIIGGHWETWTPIEDSDQNPDNKSATYYQIQPVLDSDEEPTGDLRGCTGLGLGKVRIKFSIPSNGSGLYYIKGKAINVPFISDHTFSLITGHRSFDAEGRSDGDVYFDFGLNVANVHDYVWDKRLYRLDAEIYYVPVIAIPWAFTGTLDQSKWVLRAHSNQLNAGAINVEGDIFNLKNENISQISNESELQELSDPVYIVNSHPIFSDEGTLVKDSVSFGNPVPAGNWGEYRPNIGINLFGSTLVWGNVNTPSLTNTTWPGLAGVALEDYQPNVFNWYKDLTDPDNFGLLDSLFAEAELANDLATVIAKLNCLKYELDHYDVNLTQLAEISVDAWLAYEEKVELKETEDSDDTDIINTLKTAALLTDKNLINLVNSISLNIRQNNYSVMYDGILPVIGQALSGIGSGIITGFSFSASQTSCTISLTCEEMA